MTLAELTGCKILVLAVSMLSLDAAAIVQAQTKVANQPSFAERIAASKGLLDINTASDGDLKALPGMGDAYVRRVIAGRPYTAKNQLMTRGVLPGAEYDRIRELIVAHRVKR